MTEKPPRERISDRKLDSGNDALVSSYLRKSVEEHYPGSRALVMSGTDRQAQETQFRVMYKRPPSYDSAERTSASRGLFIEQLKTILPDAKIEPCCDSDESERMGFVVAGVSRKLLANIQHNDAANFPVPREQAR